MTTIQDLGEAVRIHAARLTAAGYPPPAVRSDMPLITAALWEEKEIAPVADFASGHRLTGPWVVAE